MNLTNGTSILRATLVTSQEELDSMFRDAFRYLVGDGVVLDKSIAFELFKQAGELGDVPSMYVLGRCYEDGIGVHKNKQEAAKWYQNAADKGHAYAMFKLGYCYEVGFGVHNDEQKANEWYQKSCDKRCFG